MPVPELTDILLIAFIVALVFGASKLPALGEALGRSLPSRGPRGIEEGPELRAHRPEPLGHRKKDEKGDPVTP